MEKRTLGAALQFYWHKELINAHSAMADTEATCDVLLAQIERYKELENNTAFLRNFLLTTNRRCRWFYCV